MRINNRIHSAALLDCPTILLVDSQGTNLLFIIGTSNSMYYFTILEFYYSLFYVTILFTILLFIIVEKDTQKCKNTEYKNRSTYSIVQLLSLSSSLMEMNHLLPSDQPL